MTTFQLIGLFVLACLFFVSVRNMLPGRGRFGVSFAWSLIWVLGAVALVEPGTTVLVARWLGIGRGADLVFYVGVLVMTIGFFVVYLRIRQLERSLTQLVRRVAILGAEEPDPGAPVERKLPARSGADGPEGG